MVLFKAMRISVKKMIYLEEFKMVKRCDQFVAWKSCKASVIESVGFLMKEKLNKA